MDNSNEHGGRGGSIPIGVAVMLGACGLACAAWALLGNYVASTVRSGLILLPIVSGCAAGLLMRLGRGAWGKRTGWIAIVVTLLGCVIGDLLWIAMFNHKPIGQLLGPELVATLNTVFDPVKIVWYAVAGYLAFAISNPPHACVSD